MEETRPVEGEDFYWEGARVVFTESYHLRRGYCCGSGCRHCPFGGEEGRLDAIEETATGKTTGGKTAGGKTVGGKTG